MHDILITCVDDFKGFPEAIVSHLFECRDSVLCHSPNPQFDHACRVEELEGLYGRPQVRIQSRNPDAAELALDDLDAKWVEKHPMAIKSWRS